MVNSKRQAVLAAAVAVIAVAVFGVRLPTGAAQAAEEPAAAAIAADNAGPPRDLADRQTRFEETCFRDFADASGGLSEEEARARLQPVEGHPCKLTESSSQHGRAVTLKGLAKLRAPWSEDTALRLTLHGDKPFKLHFWHPRQGTLLHYYPTGYWASWAAYRTTRHPTGELTIGDLPHGLADAELALLCTDNGRSNRVDCGTYTIRHQDGSLVMTKGDVRLLSVPMAAPPAEVYLEGDSLLLREITMFHSRGIPEEPLRRRSVVIRGDRPARLRWQERLPEGAVLKRLSDGRVELLARDTATLARAQVPLMHPGLYEVIFELEDAMPGTGVYLGDAEGRPAAAIGFFREARSGLTYFGYDRPDQAASPAALQINTAPAPYAGRRQWLRLVLAGGVFRCFTSGNGVHWGEALLPQRNVEGFYRHIGLYIRPGEGVRRITLRRLQVRRLDAVVALAPVELRQQAMTWYLAQRGVDKNRLRDFSTWQQSVWENQPPGTDAVAWRRACAIASLIGGGGPAPANTLIGGLVEEALSAPGPLQGKLQLLEDAALIFDAATKEETDRFTAYYRRLGRGAVRESPREGFNLVRRALMTAPLHLQTYRVEAILPEPGREALIGLACQRKWADVRRLCRQLKFWNRPAKLAASWPAAQAQLRTLVDWAEARSAGAPAEQPGDRKNPLPADWRHPLVVYLGKEAYNVYSEFQAALREESFPTACRILASAAVPQEWGLVADAKDSRLFMSLPTAIALAVRRHPRLRQAMKDHFGDIDRIRLRRAMAEGNLPAVRAATLQYYATPAAAEAYCWLGDRFLAGGQFALAIGCYKRALPSAGGQQRQRFLARARLAGAMLGQEIGAPVTAPVDFGGTQLSAAEWEQLVAATLQEHGRSAAGGTNGRIAAAVSAAPQPANFSLRPWAEFSGDAGLKPENPPAGAISVDWPARQLAVVASANALIAANRFQVVSYDTATGKTKWTYSLGQQQGPAHAWSLVPMRPAPAGGRLYVRLIGARSRPLVVCLDEQSGEHLWTDRNPGYAVSDPLLLYDQLFVLTMDSASGEPISQLSLTTLDPDSGTMLDKRPLLELRSGRSVQRVCQATAADDKIVAAVAGAVLCCDIFGQLHWVRQDTWFPPSLDPNRPRRHYQPPRVVGDRVYVAQPGVRSLECIDLETGRIHWSAALPGIGRMLELSADRLLVETDHGISAVSSQTGRVLWSRRLEDLLDGYLPSGPAGLLCVKRRQLGKDWSCPVLVWLDAETGRINARHPLRSLAGRQPMVGPLVAGNGRLWCFTGTFDAKGKLGPERNILEMIAAGAQRRDDCPTPANWTKTADAGVCTAAGVVLPGWSLLSGSHDEKTGLHSQLAGQQDVLVTMAGKTPSILARRVKVPAGGKPRLLLEIAHEPQSKSKLEIRAAGLTLLQTRLGGAAAAWRQVEVDLSGHAGRELWITIVQQQAATTPAYMYWKRLEVVP